MRISEISNSRLQPFLDHLEVEQAEKAAAETEAESDRGVLLEGEGGIVELQFFKGGGQVLIIVGADRVERREDHLLHLFEAGQGLAAGPVPEGDGVARPGVPDGLDAGEDIADLAGGKLFLRFPAELEETDLLDPVFGAVGHESDDIAGLDRAVDDAHRDDGAAEGIVMGIKDQGLEFLVRIALGRRQVLDDGLKDLLDALAGFRRTVLDQAAVKAEILLDLQGDLFRFGGGEIDLVDHRDDLEIVFHGQIEIGQGLRLDPLGGVDEEQGAFAGGEGPRDFVAEIDMAGGVDEVEIIGLAISGLIWQADRLTLDGDAALAFDVHVVEQLVLELPVGNEIAVLDHAVGQGRFAMINMGDYAEISYIFHWGCGVW